MGVRKRIFFEVTNAVKKDTFNVNHELVHCTYRAALQSGCTDAAVAEIDECSSQHLTWSPL